MATYDNVSEIAIEWVKGQEVATVSAYSNSRIGNKVIKLAEQYPDECDYIKNSDGSICGHIPIKYVKISHPRVLSEEQRKKLAEQLHGIDDEEF